MIKFKSFLSLLLALPFIFTILIIHLNRPTDAQAKPLAGFTPTPTSPGGGGGGGDNNNNDDNRPTNDTPGDYVLVQVDRCNLHCSVASAYMDDQTGLQSLVSVGIADVPNSLLIPPANPQALPELLFPVRLVHDGSGFIVEGELSDMKPTRFVAPYPGRWQVWVTGSPRFMTAEAVDVTGSNLADLQSQLTNGPVSLGAVEANTSEPQLVKCPLACVVDPPTTVEAPPNLPETGGQPEMEMNFSAFLIVGGVTLSLIGLMFSAAHRDPAKNHPS